MARLRENSESVALYHGEQEERANFVSRFRVVVGNYWKIMKRRKKINWLTSSYNQLAVVFPILMAAPRFFAGKMHLGGLMQTAAAFASVHGALSYLVNSYTTIADWNAVLNRLTGFSVAIQRVETLKEREELRQHSSPDGSFSVKSLRVFLPDGKMLLQDLSLCLEPGASLLIMGESGSGKSTLIRALAGIWPFASGSVPLPETTRVMFVPRSHTCPWALCGRLCTIRIQHVWRNSDCPKYSSCAILHIFQPHWIRMATGLSRFHWESNSASLSPGFCSSDPITSSWMKQPRRLMSTWKECSTNS